MVVKFSCKICNKAVVNNHNRINLQTYKYLQKCASAWYCLKCYEELIPFTTVTNKELYQTNQGQKIKYTAVTKMVSPS